MGFDPREGLPDREAVAERTHPDDRERVREQVRRAVQQKRDYKLEYRIVLPAGTIKHVELNAHPKFSTSGELVEIVCTIIDVTERSAPRTSAREAEERLRLSEARLAEAQRLSHSGVAAYDETTILYGSEETYRIWGFDPAQGVPSREAVNQRIHPDDRDRVLAEVQRAVGARRDYSIEYRIVLPDGTAKHLKSIGRPVFSASGKLVEIVGTHLDVTERKRAEDERERLRQLESDLAHMNRLSMMGELAASLAHEITQPIAAARNNARAALNFLDRQPARPGRGQGSARLCRWRCRPRGSHRRPDS